VVLAAVQQNWRAIEFASEALQRDPEVMAAADEGWLAVEEELLLECARLEPKWRQGCLAVEEELLLECASYFSSRTAAAVAALRHATARSPRMAVEPRAAVLEHPTGLASGVFRVGDLAGDSARRATYI